MIARVKRWGTLAVVAAVFVGGGLAGWRHWKRDQIFVNTDNAYVRGDVFPVASRISGTLLTVDVAENGTVRKGQTIATIDPKDLDVAIERARASLGEAEAAFASDQAQIEQARAQVASAKSQLELAKLDEGRVRALFERKSIPRQKLDQAVAQREVAEATLAAVGKAVSAAEAKLGVSRKKADVARSSLDNALLQRTYVTVTAPADGVVSRKSAEAGQVVAAGQPLLAIVPLDLASLFVEASFKETQLRRIRPGQPVEIRVDVDPDRPVRGTVDSVSAGTGAAFALLPPENATGNWVKIVQRVPVKIRIDPSSDPDHLLRLGLSVRVEIDTRSEGRR